MSLFKRLVLLGFLSVSLSAQDMDINSLFENTDEKIETGNPEKENMVDSLFASEKFRLGAGFNAFIGYSPGWNLDSDPLFEDSGLMGLSSKITLDARVGEHFSFYQSVSVSFPDFKAEFTEIFADYDLKNRVYFRIGRQNLTWGISRYYTFTNLPARLPDDFSTDDDAEDSYAIKMDIPIGIGGIQGLMYTRNGFVSDSDYPSPDEMGWGGSYNLAMQQADMTWGAFFQREMNSRAFASVSTTLFNSLELYSEFLVSYDRDQFGFSGNLGFLQGFFSGRLELTGEYYYNGEETELNPVGAKLDLPLIQGHNFALGFSLDIIRNSLTFESYMLYNLSENTGVLAPVLTLNPGNSLELKMAVPFVFGSDGGSYTVHNPDEFDRDLSFVFTAKISGKV